MRGDGMARIPLLLVLSALLLILLGTLEFSAVFLRLAAVCLGLSVPVETLSGAAGIRFRQQRLRNPGRADAWPGAGELPPL